MAVRHNGDLPAGWAWTTLGEVSTFGPKPEGDKLSPDTQVSFVPMRNVEPLSGCINLAETRSASEVMRGYTYFEDGDVLSAKVTPCMENGKVAISRGLKNGIGFGSTEFYVTRPGPGLAPQYVFFYLIQQTVRSDAKRSMGGAVGLLRVPASFLAELELPLPPSTEQRRIVAKIEELFSQLDAGVEELKKAKAQLKRYRQSVLKAAFEGKLTEDWRKAHKGKVESAAVLLERIKAERKEALGSKYKDPPPLDTSELPELPTGWTWTTAEQLCAFITKGTTPRADKLTSGSGEVPFLKVYNLTFDGSLDFSVKPTFVTWKTHEGELARSKVYPGDVLLNIVGPPLGKVSIVTRRHPEWNVNQAIAIFRPLPGYSLRLLSYCLQTGEVLQRARKKAKTTAGQSNLTLEICRELPFPIPPEAEQGEIVAEVERRLSVADAEEKAIKAALKQAARLRQSILKRAFEGRLVPQDPTDEPADRLLERIRAEKAKHTAGLPRGRGRRTAAAGK